MQSLSCICKYTRKCNQAIYLPLAVALSFAFFSLCWVLCYGKLNRGNRLSLATSNIHTHACTPSHIGRIRLNKQHRGTIRRRLVVFVFVFALVWIPPVVVHTWTFLLSLGKIDMYVRTFCPLCLLPCTANRIRLLKTCASVAALDPPVSHQRDWFVDVYLYDASRIVSSASTRMPRMLSQLLAIELNLKQAQRPAFSPRLLP